MDSYTLLTFIVHLMAIAVLLSTIPRQLHDIWTEKEDRFRKVCWVVFIGTLCLIAMNVMPIIQMMFYESNLERLSWNTVNLLNGLITGILGMSAHMLYRNTPYSTPRTIEDMEKNKQNERK